MARASPALTIHATNLTGMGATQVLRSLLPALVRQASHYDELVVLVPDGWPEQDYLSGPPNVKVRHKRRHLPHALSRLLEILTPEWSLPVRGDLLVLGDVPLRAPRRKQVVLVQQLHLASPRVIPEASRSITFRVARRLTAMTLRYVSCLIVQSPAMVRAMEKTYPAIRGRTLVISHPPPTWVQRRHPRRPWIKGSALRLFYPAEVYRHKNHTLLHKLDASFAAGELMSVTLTSSPPDTDPRPRPWLRYAGRLGPEASLEAYAEADALVFPSLAESYGLPLVEAMFLGLPILAADLPYAHALCGEGAFYFDPRSSESLESAIGRLRVALDSGYEPDWTAQLAHVYSTWDEVAVRILATFDNAS